MYSNEDCKYWIRTSISSFSFLGKTLIFKNNKARLWFQIKQGIHETIIMTMMEIAKKLYNTGCMLVIVLKAFHKVMYSNLRTAI